MMPLMAQDAALIQQERKEKIKQLESAMLQMPQVEIPVIHTYGPGFYARTIHIKAGSTITGKVHATEHLFAISNGEMMLFTEDGERHVTAPFQCVASLGLKRVGYAVTDVVCTNFHLTDETDLEILELQLIIHEGLPASDKTEELQ